MVFKFWSNFVVHDSLNNKYTCDCRHSSKAICCLHIIITKIYRNNNNITGVPLVSNISSNSSCRPCDNTLADAAPGTAIAPCSLTLNDAVADNADGLPWTEPATNGPTLSEFACNGPPLTETVSSGPTPADIPPCDPPISYSLHGDQRKEKSSSLITQEEFSYQVQNKKYPFDLPKDSLMKDKKDLMKIKEVVPVELYCHHCWKLLSKKILLRKCGFIVDPMVICEKVKIYFKQCTSCSTRFFYKEFADGLHVGNNNVILSLDTCLLIREGLRLSTAVGRTVKTLLNFLSYCNKRHPISLNDVRETYTNFEIMTKHSYEFMCNICAVYPNVLLSDVCRKGFFQLPVDLLELVADGDRNMVAFWQDVEEAVTLKTDASSVIKEWAPWICSANTRETVISNEHQKGTKKPLSVLEETMFSQEDLLSAFENKTKAEIIEYLKINFKIIASPLTSKNDLLLLLLKHLHGTAAFNKKLYSVFGGSGGWLAMSCPNGCVYGLKSLLRHESPQDYCDMLLSMKVVPAILVCDMPDRIAKCLFQKAPSMLQPNLGMLACPTQENIALAKKDQLKIFVPGLQIRPACSGVPEDGLNPATGSSKIFVLYDELHKVNTNKETEKLRHLILVENCNFKLNTIVSKQTNRVIGQSHYYLDKMNPLTHIFYLRLRIELLNQKRNEELKKKMEI